MKNTGNTPLVLAFIISVVIFLLFCGGAITMTLSESGINKNGLLNNISWMWIPTIVAFILSGLIGWVIFWQKKD